MKYKYFPAFILFLLIFSFKGYSQNDFAVIMKNIFENIQSGSTASLNDNVTHLLSIIQQDGSWPDINYQNHSQTHWTPGDHLNRMATLCEAYSLKGSAYYANPNLLNTITNAMHYWLDLDPAPSSTNWYYRSITVPQAIGRALICMRLSSKGISKKLETDMLSWMMKGIPIYKSPSRDGSNLIDVARHYIMRACLTRDTGLLNQTVNLVENSIAITTGEGIQSDYSFHAHGPQLYMYGYGSVFAAGITHIYTFLKGTKYAFSSEKMMLFSNFIRQGYIPVSRGRYTDFNVLGRGISRPGSDRADVGLVREVAKMDIQKYKSVYQAAVQRMEGTVPPSFQVQPTHTYFWRSDYTVDQRPDYMFALRCVSTRTVKCENGNGENLKGYYLTDGATDIAVNGNEYNGIYPVWDWNKIPGTTVPAINSFPLRPSWGRNPGKTNFVGGVSDGVHGASVYDMNDYNTTAKKAWFFFDHEIVCLGAGITSTAAEPINTTVNQCLLDGNVTIKVKNEIKTLSSGHYHFPKEIRWVFHDSVGYFFPEKSNIAISNQAQTGSQYNINHAYDDKPITKNVFKLWIQQGLNPDNAGYEYIVVPGITSVKQMKDYNISNIKILYNTNNMQAVENKTLHNLQIVFYTTGTFTSGKLAVQVDKPCILMLENIYSNNISVYAADPSQQADSLHINLKTPKFGKIKLNLSLPKGQYAGSTVSSNINNK